VDRITSNFPTFTLREVITEAKATIGGNHVILLEIVGGAVRLLIGNRSTQLAPVLKFTLPGGLCVYETKFRDVYGVTLCFGGPLEVITKGYKQTGSHMTTGMLQVLFTETRRLQPTWEAHARLSICRQTTKRPTEVALRPGQPCHAPGNAGNRPTSPPLLR
jgi:hypothetical protein